MRRGDGGGKPAAGKEKDHAPCCVSEGMVKVPKGQFLCGAAGDREVIDHDYWIGQYPITNEKYSSFIRASGYTEQIYWSPEGWRWKAKNNITEPRYWNDEKWNQPITL